MEYYIDDIGISELVRQLVRYIKTLEEDFIYKYQSKLNESKMHVHQ